MPILTIFWVAPLLEKSHRIDYKTVVTCWKPWEEESLYVVVGLATS